MKWSDKPLRKAENFVATKAASVGGHFHYRAMSPVGTFETCGRTAMRSAFEGRAEVAGARSSRRNLTRSSHSELPGRHSHDPAKLFHPSRMVKQFSGWDEVILPAHETSQKQTPAMSAV